MNLTVGGNETITDLTVEKDFTNTVTGDSTITNVNVSGDMISKVDGNASVDTLNVGGKLETTVGGDFTVNEITAEELVIDTEGTVTGSIKLTGESKLDIVADGGINIEDSSEKLDIARLEAINGNVIFTTTAKETEIDSIVAKNDAKVKTRGDLTINSVDAFNVTITALGEVNATTVKAIGHVEINAILNLNVDTIEANSIMLIGGPKLSAKKLLSYGPVVINAINVDLGEVEGYDIRVSVNDELKYKSLAATRNVLLKSNGKIVTLDDSSMKATYGTVTVQAKKGFELVANSTIESAGGLEVTTDGSDDSSVILNGKVSTSIVNINQAKQVIVKVDKDMNDITVSTSVGNSDVQFDMTGAEGNVITVTQTGTGDKLTVITTDDKQHIKTYSDRIEVVDKGVIYLTEIEMAIVNAMGSENTVDIVEMPCDLDVNTSSGDDVINVGVLYTDEQENINGTAMKDGWLSVGATHVVNINTGAGSDRVNVYSASGQIRFSGGEDSDTLYAKEFYYSDSYKKYPIGNFGAYKDVETVTIERLVDLYTVVPEDNLTKIAEKFGVTVEQLVEWNGEQIHDPHWIYPGQVFVVGPYKTSIETIPDRIAS